MIVPARHLKTPIDTYYYNKIICKNKPVSNIVDKIRGLVKDETGIDPYIDTKYQGSEFVTARQLFMYFVRHYAKLSQYATGRLIEKDHATVVHAEKSVLKYKEVEKSYCTMFDNIERKILKYK